MNEEAVRLAGVNTKKIIMIIYTVNGLLAAITGLLYIARLNAAEATIGNDFTIKMMAAVLIGGTPFAGGRGGVGTYFYWYLNYDVFSKWYEFERSFFSVAGIGLRICHYCFTLYQQTWG
jgi:ribose/xylose/arabinose/galactoside ABC-type transport system permease subunit